MPCPAGATREARYDVFFPFLSLVQLKLWLFTRGARCSIRHPKQMLLVLTFGIVPTKAPVFPQHFFVSRKLSFVHCVPAGRNVLFLNL